VIGQRLEVRQGQGLVITPQLQQAIKLLQLSNLELEAFVEGELERNPLLQRDEGEAGGDSSAEAVEAAARTSHEALGGRIDILVASAGITGATVPVHEFPLDSWKRVVDINLNGVFYCCRAVTPYMLDNGYGRIVNVASVAGKEGNPNASAYSASKAGVIGFTKSLGKELAGKGVIANSLTPATFESPILEQLPQSQVDYMRSKIPMGRLGEVEESVAMVCFMASEECSFTTASTFDTSGGRTTY